ncbi:MAG: hypothetical protein IJJ29_05055, partial [Solobacterium sp.]|nr:hypothetical protein [Solobacterium sp.]
SAINTAVRMLYNCFGFSLLLSTYDPNSTAVSTKQPANRERTLTLPVRNGIRAEPSMHKKEKKHRKTCRIFSGNLRSVFVCIRGFGKNPEDV